MFHPPESLNSLWLPGAPEETRIVVAMSGGVDSSVVAALLKEQGYDVVGITLQLYDHGMAVNRKGSCCAGTDIHDARRVAEAIGIPHYVLDYEQKFESSVMDEFADSYLAGETPIPCVTCNQKIKFHSLLDMAKELGAQALATGHYISSRPALNAAGGSAGESEKWEMYRAADAERDQSYFLFATTQEQLSFLRFPLGRLKKPQVRELAHKYGLQVADKSDSQDICFVPTGRYTQVIERLRPGASEPGCIVHIDGRILGDHDGIIHYTIGQRRGLGVASGEPLYVIRLDAATREVIVGPRSALEAHWIMLRNVNWLGTGEFSDSFEAACKANTPLYAKIRSTQAPQEAHLGEIDGVPALYLENGEEGVSPGQACVFYSHGSETEAENPAQILGGGWISKVVRQESHEDAEIAAPQRQTPIASSDFIIQAARGE